MRAPTRSLWHPNHPMLPRLSSFFALLALAIVSEVIATSALKSAAGFTRPLPSLLVVAGYGVAFYSLSRVLETVPVGVAYAIWSGVGIVLVALAGWAIYGQKPDPFGVLGMALIIAGVVVLNLLSRMSAD